MTRPAFLAEVSSNHHQQLDRCLAMVDAAAVAGCRGVKFQLFRIRDLFSPEALASRGELRAREAWELPASFLPDIAARCAAAQVDFVCTPFYLAAVDTLMPFVAAFKIASYELLWDDLLKRCAATGKPVILSTGMATPDEIRRAVDVIRAAGCRDLTLLHCVSGYPAPPEECNLAAIETLRTIGRCPVGWSDHSANPAVILRAVHRWRASLIEFHLDLDGTGDEFQTGHCWLPDQIASVIRMVQVGCDADGAGDKVPMPSERADREWRADPSDGLRPLKSTRETLSPKVP
jgi:N-acetylneuraminate synthase